MYFKKTSACHNIVLNAMFHEVNALNDEIGGCDKHSRLEALQALAMYVIVLACDPKRCNLLSVMTRVAMGEIARKLVDENGDFSTNERMGKFPTWDEWRFAESSRRTLLLIHLMDQVLDFNIGSPNITACRQFDTLPLTCSKEMWEATTCASWEIEYTQYLASRKGNDMLRYGDLRKSSHLDAKDLNNDMVSDIATWASNVDSLGSMLLNICH
ncbi:hypothetical protein ONS95_012464 [Cadophora gregata]|uniref:uncharacterized protein n=1 Tax=Cadophora gregata TaxID=51156 RepID=UPI0026DA9935|nr:uncharacterized protein ONS95_012464 [Cadophora gregata]KAK0118158.1 hypothetical protein ONS95_012464 [Cadophora gregata]KAK0123231.1 hypothetical protein ONS96_010230 [Cadophora gregata f. sp. sojae]